MDEHIKSTLVAVGLLTGLMCLGILGYMAVEDYTLLNALYMTVITISTVGFGEIRPLSDNGLLFTVILIMVSIGVYGYVLTTVTRHILDGVFTNYFKHNRVKRKIKKLNDHVVICGYGRVGKQATTELLAHGETVLVIDVDNEEIEHIKEKPELLYIEGDATSDEVLQLAQIKKAKSLITTMPKDADNLFVVLSARELCPELTIISRASEEQSDIKLKRAGATNVIMPDRIGGKRMAKLVSQPDIVEFLDNILIQDENKVNIQEINCKSIHQKFVGKTISDIGIRNKSGANIIGLKQEDNSYLFNPPPETVLDSNNQIFVLGTKSQVESFKSLIISGI